MISRTGALCSIFLSVALALGLSGTAAAENADIQMVEQEIIITVKGEVYEVGVDVESVEEFIEENRPDGISTMAWREDFFTYGTLRTQTTSCSYASIDYFKTGGSSIRVDFGVAQVGRATKLGQPVEEHQLRRPQRSHVQHCRQRERAGPHERRQPGRIRQQVHQLPMKTPGRTPDLRFHLE